LCVWVYDGFAISSMYKKKNIKKFNLNKK
jgi:hypothetical protein